MKLEANWLTKGLLDYEYKKYILLAYLKDVASRFDENKLYPFLSDLVFHYENLITFKENKKIAGEEFPKKISKVDFEKFAIVYERLIEDESFVKEIESIVNYAIPKIQDHIEDGKDIYDFVEEKLEIFPIGVIPLNQEFGYMFLREGQKKKTSIYEFQITIFESADEKYRGINMDYVTSYQKNHSNTYESIKTDLIRTRKELANPATYAVESMLEFPLRETLLPIAKRSLVRIIAHSAA
ncbi:MAG: hypothetical protein IH946_04305 [Bacteroidetes bacterium]|nr:hypothetical protein [Bacteroidota bacterium]